ncbi:MAG: hypothetical protein ACPGUD_04115 [Parashewanella sp.]
MSKSIKRSSALIFLSYLLVQSAAIAAPSPAVQQQNNSSDDQVVVTPVQANNFASYGAAAKLVCKLHRSPKTCIPIVDVSILPIRVSFPESKLHDVMLNQLSMVTVYNKTEVKDTMKIIVKNGITGKELFNGDAKNYVGIKCILNKCSDL